MPHRLDKLGTNNSGALQAVRFATISRGLSRSREAGAASRSTGGPPGAT